MLSDIKFAIRMLLKNPAFTLTCIGILGLGIGAAPSSGPENRPGRRSLGQGGELKTN